jgi:histidyl-tRNA synthetase
VLLLMARGTSVKVPVADIYVVAAGERAQEAALAAVETVRGVLPALRIVQHTGGGSFKSQMKKADKSGASLALIWGDDEAQANTVTVKTMRSNVNDSERMQQQNVPLADLEATLRNAFAEQN